MDSEELKKIYEDTVLDKFHAHEALDRAFIMSEMFGLSVLEHPFIFKNEKLKEKAEEISQGLFDLYQMTSNLSLDLYDH